MQNTLGSASKLIFHIGALLSWNKVSSDFSPSLLWIFCDFPITAISLDDQKECTLFLVWMAAVQILSSGEMGTSGYYFLYYNLSYVWNYFQSLRSLALKELQILDKVTCYTRENERVDRKHVMERGSSVCVLPTGDPSLFHNAVGKHRRRWAVSLLVHIICHESFYIFTDRGTSISMQSLLWDQWSLGTLGALPSCLLM